MIVQHVPATLHSVQLEQRRWERPELRWAATVMLWAGDEMVCATGLGETAQDAINEATDAAHARAGEKLAKHNHAEAEFGPIFGKAA